jgi:DNA repair protein RecN (Recombination protein N)
MLLELNVSQFAIINNIHVKFKGGLNILSGETGAGKSVLLKSLSLLMGEKASAETVRTGSDHAIIEGLFDITDRPDISRRLEEQGIPKDDDSLIVRRIVAANGKSKIYINGSLTTLNVLQNIVAPLIEVTGQAIPLIEMTGQHENRHLLSKGYHLDLLDAFSGTSQLRDAFAKDFDLHQGIKEEIESIQNEARVREQRLDFLKYQRDEIKNLDLKIGDETSLQALYDRSKNASRLSDWASASEHALLGDDESAIVRLHRVIQKGTELRKYDSEIENKLKPLQDAKGLIEEFVYELRGYTSELEDGEDSLDKLEARISDLRKLQKKYGEKVEDILVALAEIERELGLLENSDQRLEDLQKQLSEVQLRMKKMGEQLHTKRLQGAKLLTNAVNDELSDLNMKGTSFVVTVQKLEDFSSSGLSDVEFMIKASPKDPERAIAKVASGGELSRILLALKSIIGVGEYPRSYLFDEVDTGVSGPTAEKVGKKLKAIAKGQQVVCVTHLPQVACFADHHYYIRKHQTKTGVSMDVKELEPQERVEEIARLISGEKITKSSLEHARELLRH